MILTDMQKVQEELEEANQKESDDFWNNLSKEQQMLAFYSVCKRIHLGDIQHKGSYRHVLYQVFGFGLESYSLGMECGYIDIHNYIQDGIAAHKNVKREE